MNKEKPDNSTLGGRVTQQTSSAERKWVRRSEEGLGQWFSTL